MDAEPAPPFCRCSLRSCALIKAVTVSHSIFEVSFNWPPAFRASTLCIAWLQTIKQRVRVHVVALRLLRMCEQAAEVVHTCTVSVKRLVLLLVD